MDAGKHVSNHFVTESGKQNDKKKKKKKKKKKCLSSNVVCAILSCVDYCHYLPDRKIKKYCPICQ